MKCITEPHVGIQPASLPGFLPSWFSTLVATFPSGRWYRVFDVLQGGGERVDELVGQLGQEADGVHVEHGHVTGQLASVHRHVQRSEQLVLGL